MKNRNGTEYCFEAISPNQYRIKGNLEYWRIGSREGQDSIDCNDLGFVDPSGGPFISIGYLIDGRKVSRISIVDNEIVFSVE